MKDLALRDRGLILLTGPTGSGKSTTLATMVDYINEYKNHADEDQVFACIVL